MCILKKLLTNSLFYCRYQLLGKIKLLIYPAFCAPVAVLGWNLDGAETIDRDTEDGIDGAQTDCIVERQPEVADHRAERPVLPHEQIDRVERHRDGADEQVADGQRRDEVVRRLADVALDNERQNHDQVTAHRHDAGGPGEQAEYHDLPNLQYNDVTSYCNGLQLPQINKQCGRPTRYAPARL